MRPLLHIQSLSVSADKKQLIKNLSLSLGAGEFHVLMGPNGSGKSTLAAAIMGHPQYKVRAQTLTFAGRDIRTSTPDERARAGVFLAFQNPLTISGVSLSTLLPVALKASVKKGAAGATKKDTRLFPTLASREAVTQQETLTALKERLAPTIAQLALTEDIIYRGLNEGFSGGEKKKAEMLQLVALRPKLAILDEPDSGLDVDALKKISIIMNQLQKSGTAILLITHYPRAIRYLKPDAVHILYQGTIIKSGGAELARAIEAKGFEGLLPNKKNAKHRNTKKNTRA